jgi:protein-S-isoprenylcysteine O-methyltransferase Ste14
MASTRRHAAYSYGLAAYLLALATVAYAVGFLANVLVPKSVDAGAGLPVGDPIVVNLALVGLFGLQHSVMARPWFKERWTRLVPEPIERSTYVLLASLALVVLMSGWRPLPGPVWTVDGPLALALWAVSLGGWLLMLASTEMIDGADLMGLRQVRAYRDGREVEPIDFQTPYLYRYVRNPIMVGFLVAFWVTPRMSVGHLLFASGMTIFVLVGVKLEERDLLAAFDDRYRRYRRDVPMFLPRPWRLPSTSPGDSPTPADTEVDR